MTVQELIEYLRQFEGDLPVYFSTPAGDYWHSTLALKPKEPEMGKVKYSGYFEKMVVTDEEDESDENQEVIEAVVL